MRIVAQLAWKYWRSLPQHIQAHVDVEDMIQDAALCLARQKRRYRRNKAAYSTWAYTLANRYFINHTKHYSAKKRSAIVVELDTAKVGVSISTPAWESRKALEVLFTQASSSLRNRLDELFAQARPTFTTTEIEEIQTLVKRNGIRRVDIEYLLRFV